MHPCRRYNLEFHPSIDSFLISCALQLMQTGRLVITNNKENCALCQFTRESRLVERYTHLDHLIHTKFQE